MADTWGMDMTLKLEALVEMTRIFAAQSPEGTTEPFVVPEPEAEFDSPATENAFSRMEDKLLRGVDGETRADVDDLLAEVRARSVELAARDGRPYGRSVEHDLKKMFIQAAKRGFAVDAYASAPAPMPDPAAVGVSLTLNVTVGEPAESFPDPAPGGPGDEVAL